MKKLMVLFTLLIFCLSASLSLAEDRVLFSEEYISNVIKAETGARFFRTKSTFGGDTAYMCMEDGVIYAWRAGEDEARAYCKTPDYPKALMEGTAYDRLSPGDKKAAQEIVTHIVASESALYAINAYAGRVGSIDEGGLHWRDFQFDEKLLMMDSRLQRHISCIIANDSVIALTALDDSFNNFSLITISLETGDVKTYPSLSLNNLCFYKDGYLLALRVNSQSRYVLSVIDILTGSAEDLSYELPKYDYSHMLAGLAYDKASDAIYYSDQSAVYRSVSGAPFERVKPFFMEAMDEGYQGAVLRGGGYALTGYGVRLFDIDGASNEKTLTVNIHRGSHEKLYEAFTKQHPGVNLDIRYDDISTADAGESIRSGRTEVDIYQLYVDSAFTAFINKGYAADLSASEEIKKDFNTLYPAIQGSLTGANGGIYAYPQQMNVSLTSVNKTLWRELFGDMPVPETWTELFEAALRFESEGMYQDGALFFMEWSYRDMLFTVVDSFMQQKGQTSAPDFHDEGFTAALEALARLNDAMRARGIETLSEPDMYPYEEILNKSLFYFFGGGNSILRSTAKSREESGDLPPFTFGKVDTPVIRGFMSALVVNPLSDKQELAREFIALASSRDMDLERCYLIHPGENEPVDNPDYAERLAEYERERPDGAAWYRDNMRYYISPEGIEIWRGLAPMIRYFEASPFVTHDDSAAKEQLRSLCAQYADGSMTLPAFQSRLDEMVRMITLEQQ